jgi:hypothetical protein
MVLASRSIIAILCPPMRASQGDGFEIKTPTPISQVGYIHTVRRRSFVFEYEK